jgi:hypothetical protein
LNELTVSEASASGEVPGCFSQKCPESLDANASFGAQSLRPACIFRIFFVFVANSATNLHLSELFTLADDSLHVLRMRSSRPFELGLVSFGEARVRIVHP